MPNKKILKRKKNDGRCSDLTFQWLIKNRGIEWDIWRQLAEEWITQQEGGVSNKLDALCIFFDIYLVDTLPFTTDVVSFFDNKNGRYASIDEFKSILLKNSRVTLSEPFFWFR